MSGEIDSDVAGAYREVRRMFEDILNGELESNEYGEGLAEWNYLAMILGKNSPPDYQEVKRYDTRGKAAEFRLIIDHDRFKNGTVKARSTLLAESLLRSLALLDEMKVPNADVAGLRRDFISVAEREGWLP